MAKAQIARSAAPQQTVFVGPLTANQAKPASNERLDTSHFPKQNRQFGKPDL